ncbi:hypothetical protein BC940DRAFT_330549 [Gongronella butleri]|nr:hypothetical protein BC940DRAFT_330549 [Gongronella butleri]
MFEYSNAVEPRDPPFWRLCDTETGVCHCDLRMTIYNCVESEGLKIVNIVDIVWSVLATFIACGILFFRITRRNQHIFDSSSGFPRPKPIDALALFGILFNVCRIINASVLLADVANNAIFRSFMFELPWQFGITALACYMFGVANTLSNSSSKIFLSWVHSQRVVDILSVILISLPYVTINVAALGAGYYAQINDIPKATSWTEAIYYMWLVYTFVLGGLILFAGLRLLKLLTTHLLTQNDNRANMAKIKTGAVKVKIIIGIGCFCLWAFTVMIALYASSRYQVMQSPEYTIILAAFALFNGPLATSVVEFAVFLNPRMLQGLASLSFGTSQGTQSQPGSAYPQFGMTSQDRQSNVLQSGSQQATDLHAVSSPKALSPVLEPMKPAQLGYSLSNYTQQQPSHLYRHHGANDDQSNITVVESDPRLEEEQRYYNAMANQLRMPPHFTTSDDRRYANDSLTSVVYDDSNISGTHLLEPYPRR